MRLRLFPLLWSLLWPLRLYLLHSPLPRGKGFITRRLLLPLLPPPPHSFLANLAGGEKAMLQYRETIGLSILLRGGFEIAETEVLRRSVKPATVAIDVGANVGIASIPMAQAIGPQGSVLAFEPLPENAQRLKTNVGLNGLSNVEIHAMALGNTEGVATLHLSDDPAYCSTTEVSENRANGKAITVPVATLDQVWQEAGRPIVSVMKIDVEGGEMAVLEGSEQLLASCRPVILVEVSTPERLISMVNQLSRLGYAYSQPSGFKPWNHLFVANGAQP